MNEQESNKKLAEWAGFKECFEFDTGVGYSQYPDGTCNNDAPDFTQSLDACFKWLVPKLRELKYYVVLRDISKSFYCSLLFTTAGSRSWFGKAETPALALCLAISKIIDNGE